MDITLGLSAMPLWISGPLLVGLTTAIAMCASLMLRRRYAVERLMTNNEVAGFKFATIGVIYAVLLGFAVIVVWEKFRDADYAVTQEAGAVVGLYRLSGGMEAAAGATVRARLTDYVKMVITDDWPAMSRGFLSPAATRALNAVYAAVLADAPQDNRGAVALTEMFHQLDVVTQSRRARVVLAAGIVPGVVWFVLFLGAVLTVGFTLFFGTQNLRAQVLMTGLLTAIIFLGLMVIVSIDHPFTGPVSLQPAAFRLVLQEFAGGT